jgi:hypothetical protein
MIDTPELLLAHHLKALKLPTSLREYGLVPLTFRSFDSFMRPFVRMPRGFCYPVMSGGGVNCRTH